MTVKNKNLADDVLSALSSAWMSQSDLRNIVDHTSDIRVTDHKFRQSIDGLMEDNLINKMVNRRRIFYRKAN